MFETEPTRFPAEATSAGSSAPDAPRALLISSHLPTVQEGRRSLRDRGFDVKVVAADSNVSDLLVRERADVVLVDGSLRTGDGTGICSTLRSLETFRTVPILVLCDSRREIALAKRAGASDVVLKPADWEILAGRAMWISELCGSTQRLQAERRKLEESLRQVQTRHDHLQKWSTVDRLTGLPNRGYFHQVLQQSLSSSIQRGHSVAVIYLDLDQFNVVNHTLGRAGGNAVLRQVGARLSSSLRSRAFVARNRAGLMTSAVARLSGDEFTLLLTNVEGVEDASKIARSLLDQLSEAIEVDGETIYLNASLGLAIGPQHGEEGDDLLHRAEVAMLEAKKVAGSAVRVYRASVVELRSRRAELDRHLHGAWDRGEMSLHYQPLMDLQSGRMIGAEALLRWTNPQLGVVGPAEFVPVAEQSGLMVELGAQVFREACWQLRRWLDEGLQPIRMAVNVSTCQLQRPDFADLVAATLEETELDPELVELELSERGGLSHDPVYVGELERLKELGVRLSVDDFGTGDSAISYLKRLPLDTLKIDSSFVAGAELNQDDATIGSAIAAMAQRLSLRVIAEGVETTNQAETVRAWGCEEFQGYLFSPAVTAERFRLLLSSEVGFDL